jgi:SAM-dependent methyltransferase
MRVLDAGCGTGVLAERLAASGVDISYVGVDLSPAMLARARARRPWPAGFTFIEADVDDVLAEAAAGFDRIASVNVIWTLPDPAATLTRMTVALRPGGHMVHATPKRAFKPYAIVLRHLRGRRGWRLVRALGALPLLLVAGLINLVLVMHSGWSARGPGAGKRWDRDGLVALLRASGAVPRETRGCYADQDLLLVATREADALASGSR